jgi:hypothetical protein
MKREKDARGSALRSTSGANPVILSGSYGIFTLSEMKHQKNSYNDNKVEVASWSIDTIPRTPECLNTIPLAEIAPYHTLHSRYRSSAVITYELTRGGRLSRIDKVKHAAFGSMRKTGTHLVQCRQLFPQAWIRKIVPSLHAHPNRWTINLGPNRGRWGTATSLLGNCFWLIVGTKNGMQGASSL